MTKAVLAQEIRRVIALKKELTQLKEEIDGLKEIHNYYNDYLNTTEKKLLDGEFVHIEMIQARTKKLEAMMELFFKVHQ